MKHFIVRTHTHEQMLDVTRQIQDVVDASGVSSGACLVFVPHTTAGVTINENADPDVPIDLLRGLAHAVPDQAAFRHAEGNSTGHIKSTLVGCDQLVIIEGGRLALGTWQSVFFCEFDGPRSRKVWVKVMGQADAAPGA